MNRPSSPEEDDTPPGCEAEVALLTEAGAARREEGRRIMVADGQPRGCECHIEFRKLGPNECDSDATIILCPLHAAAPETAAERDRLRAQNADLLVALEGLLREVEYVGTSSVPIMRGWQNSGSAIEARAAIKRAGETT